MNNHLMAPPPRFACSATLVRFALCGLILFAVFAIYGQCVYDQFIEFDDGMYVFRNDVVRSGLTWRGFKWALTSTEVANWHPVTWWAHMADVEMFGLFAGGHALSNVILHGLAAVVLFLVLEKYTSSLVVAAFVALVFAVHPANVESVAWISEKKSCLSALFVFLAFGAYWRYSSSPTWPRYGLVLFFYALSLASKPMMVSFPLLVCLLDFWPLRRTPWSAKTVDARIISATNPSHEPNHRWKNSLWLIDKLPLIALAIAEGIITCYAQYKAASVETLAHVPRSTALIANALFSYIRYIGHLLFPHKHALLYPFQAHYPPLLVISCILILVGITYLAIRRARPWPALFVGWFWFLITLGPVIGILQVGSQAMADRYLYIPMIGPVLWLAMTGRSLGLHWPQARRVIWVIGAGWIAALTLAAKVQASYWINNELIMRQAIANTEGNFILRGALGIYYFHQNRLLESEEQYREGLKTKPDNAGLLANLAATLGRSGKFPEAIMLLEKSLRLSPKDPGNHNNLGIFYAQSGRVEEGIREFKEAIRLKPDYTDAKNNFTAALALLPKSSPTPATTDRSLPVTSTP